jgi:RNA polymerase sigma-70 factor (ECF subfamily)
LPPAVGATEIRLEARLAIAREIPRLRRFARALLRDASAADDLVQDCLVRALGAHPRFPAAGKVRPWLFAILRNLYRDRLRSRLRQPGIDSIDDVADEELGEAPRQIDVATAISAIDALADLPGDQREVLVLVAVEGCSYREAAEILAIPTGTLMSRLSRARERMRILLEAPAPRGGHLRSVKP